MSMTDPISDMFTRIRNAQMVGRASVNMPSSRIKKAIAGLLKDEGYILDFNEVKDGNKADLDIQLKYFQGKPAIERLKRYSRPGLRVYRSKDDLPKVMGGLGIAIVTTSAGLMTGTEATKQGVGGEVIALVA